LDPPLVRRTLITPQQPKGKKKGNTGKKNSSDKNEGCYLWSQKEQMKHKIKHRNTVPLFHKKKKTEKKQSSDQRG